ncbi:MAG TPA: TadE/TadG family type IV pilus assembly protein [Pyrinomonadaceae bacterium]|nr:TadE/TadG family type IV pilus assembly protein [Pyrinomonadaceae bacterium]
MFLRRFARNEKGGTLAELAILIPFLIMLAASVAELGRLFQTYTTLSKSTRNAARYLSGKPYDPVHIAFTRNMALCGKTACEGGDELVTGLELANVVVEAEPPTGAPIRVTVRIDGYNFEPLFNLAALFNAEDLVDFPVRPSTTMYYMLNNTAGSTE